MTEAIRDADVIMMLRVQLERRMKRPWRRANISVFTACASNISTLAKRDVLVMHPGPINRGRELSSEVADSQSSVILNQVENGIAVRMAVLERILGGGA